MPIRTFGVEEELLLVHPADGSPAPLGDQVVQAASMDPEAFGIEHEFKREQAEIGSDPRTTAAELLDDLRARRRRAAEVAEGVGARIAALATHPFPVRPTPTADERYLRMTAEFGWVARQQLTCGQHVHVGISSREEGVAALDRIRPWLATVVALSANSPFWQGRPSGYHSYRTLAWSLWPTSGPTELFGDPAGYDRAIAELIASGAAMDDGMIYFDARLSAKYPTLEIRVADVCTDVRDSVLIAVLCRALVSTAINDWQDGRPAPDVRTDLLQGAAWRAARFGLSGQLVDVAARTTVPAAELLGTLLQHLTPELDRTGDLEYARAGLARLLADGTGASRQLAVHDATGELSAVVADAADRTVG
ncbi:YbdK family carboxylate-amine ligase [Nakamurella sp. YIM 132087]|uniref:Putative glutamate--cysteine ligase 2 n=1 Tax=Nakamurella alba TaxID=2665158 RepID=A0A7K1FNI1_9ACTN|nr:glutamate--cysteine ligase [Nakamurella alba]MTD15727.1 YbdK family carboxylate-amine ligase [Nakamurella alba]